eukprot:TRINITY_DN12083_c0_g1_i1.p1 TRINITY_DN12083_c0_g1~~TRINITY_DN12083_c0_g1_i1.p1  ORF type:complete len:241 (+),score=45.51 TRINITY_DN12083_c0_g1_i1:85-807(+)
MVTRILHNGYNHYSINNVVLPSVTTILAHTIWKPFLVEWEKKIALKEFRDRLVQEQNIDFSDKEKISEIMNHALKKPEETRDKASRFGITAHSIFQSIINGVPYDCPNEFQPVKDAFLSWREKTPGLSLIECEKTVFSTKHGYAGTVDAIGVYKKQASDMLIAFDWKTSNEIRKEYGLQIAAYAKAYEEMTGRKVQEGIIVRFDKLTPVFQAKRVKELDGAFSAFLSCLNLYKFLKSDTF